MESGFMVKRIRRAGRNVAIAGLILLAIVIACFWGERNYFYNFFRGPFPIDQAGLLSLQSPESRREVFVAFQADAAEETGFEEQSTEYFVTTHHPILAVKLGDRLLLAKASSKGVGDTHLSGELISIPSDIRGQVLQKLLEKYPQLNGRFLPYMMDATGYRFEGYFGLPFGIAVAALAAWMIFTGMRSMSQPETTKVWRQLEKNGSAQQAVMAIDMEMAAEGGGEKFGAVHLTTHWLVNATVFSVSAMNLEDLAWGYQKITKQYHNGIPAGKTFQVVVLDRTGHRLELVARKNSAPALLQAVSKRAPWMIAGFSADLEKLWKQRRAEFLQAVDQRKTQLKNTGAPAVPAASKQFTPS